MPKFRIRLSQRVYYDATVSADTPAAAFAEMARQLYESDGDEPDMVEVDSEDFTIEPDIYDERGAAISGATALLQSALAARGRRGNGQ